MSRKKQKQIKVRELEKEDFHDDEEKQEYQDEHKGEFRDDTPKRNKKLDHMEEKAERAEKKTERARKRMPSKKEYKLVRQYDAESGETTYKLETIRHPKGPKKQSLKKKIKKLQEKQFQVETAFRMEKYLEENPEIRKRFYRKFLQKQRIRREYAKALKKGAAQAAESAEYAQKATQTSTIVARKLMEYARQHITAVITIGSFGLFFMIIATMISSCGAIFGGSSSTVIAGAYQSQPRDIDSSEDSMKEKEMYLQNDIDNIEADYPGYDEYEYDIGHIGHNPFTLINYLSATLVTFTASGAESTVQDLFNEMYVLTLTPREETRTREVTTTIPGPIPGEDIITTEEEEYTVSILNVTLTVKSLEEIVNEKLTGNDEAQQLYDGYGVTCGLLQHFYSPVTLDWMSRISCYYGYRVHPISGENQFHRGLDIAIPEGTELYAAMDGTVMTATYDDSYGNYVVIKDANGYETKYAHMQSLSVTPGQTVAHGDLIGYSGNTGGSTGPHLHLECLVNGEYYNPIFYFANGV